jgi:hypothetical protein
MRNFAKEKTMKQIGGIVIMSVLAISLSFGTVLAKNVKTYPKLTGEEGIPCTGGVPYLGGRQSPGDQIGTTWYDIQFLCGGGGSGGQRIIVDSKGQAHIDWMKMDAAASVRFCAWNARFVNGSYFGETQASQPWSGYVQIDVTRDTNPDNQRSVIAYHWQSQSWIDIDAGNLWGSWPNDPKTPGVVDHIWVAIAVASNNNIVMATGDYDSSVQHLYLTTNLGETWTHLFDTDSTVSLSQFLRASRNSGSHKMVYSWVQSIALEYGGFLISQVANDVCYRLSTDNGLTWGSPVNITNYLPPGMMVNGDSTPWALSHVNGVFDNNDNLHLAWGAHLGWVEDDTLYYYERAKVFHWDEVSGTVSTVNSPSIYYPEPGGWWLQRSVYNPGGEPGAWRIQADQPQLVVGNGDTLYCLWHGNDDTTDVSAAGYVNGEIYGAYSTDNGLTWSNYVNLTNTRSPGAPAGACMDEDYMTANPFVVNDSIFITYVEDKDAGAYPNSEGVATENPVRCWVFPESLIVYGIEEHITQQPQFAYVKLFPNPSAYNSVIDYTMTKSGSVSIKLFDVAGRFTKNLYTGYKDVGIYTLNVLTHDLANGTYFVILETSTGRASQTLLVVH